jgi:hypothetical protein
MAVLLDSGASDSIESFYEVSTNQNAFHVHQMVGQGASATSGNLSSDMDMTFIPTSSGTADSYSKLGESFYYKGNLGTSDVISSASAYSLGYIF